MERAALWGAPLDHRPSPLSPLPLASHPQAGISELSKQLSAAWKEVGEEEKKAGTVNVRTRDNQVRAAGGASRAAGSHRCCCSRWPPACVPQPARRQRC